MRAGVAPVTPRVIQDSRGTVSDVVVGRHDEAGVHERDDHVEITARMLAEAVNELHDTLGFARWDVNPADNLVTLVR